MTLTVTSQRSKASNEFDVVYIITFPSPGFTHIEFGWKIVVVWPCVYLSVCVTIILMEVAAATAAIKTAGNAMGGSAFTNSLLVFRLPSLTVQRHAFTRPPLKALPSRYDDDEMNTRLIKPDQKLQRSSADSHSCNTTANPAYDNNRYSPLHPPRHQFHINDDVQGRMQAYRSKCHRQVLDEGVIMGRAFYREFAEYVSSVWLHKDLARKYYQKALTQMEMNASSTSKAGGLMAEYAEFLWKAFGNGEEANRVFENAVREYPEDVQLLGSYASFLWELSEND